MPNFMIQTCYREGNILSYSQQITFCHRSVRSRPQSQNPSTIPYRK